jgi:hypothetical protein
MDIVFATETRQVSLKTGATFVVHKGTHWPAEDEVVRSHPAMFSTDARYGLFYSCEPEGYDAPIEAATAAPGEKRSVSRPMADDSLHGLRAHAQRLGIDVDMRWGPARLRQEIDNASS